MATKSSNILSPRELKTMKKDDLIRLVLKAREGESPQNVRTVNSQPSKSRSSLGSNGTLGTDFDVDWLTMQIKSAVQEAVQDIKTELRAEYQALFKDMSEKFTNDISNLQSEIDNLKAKLESQAHSLEKEFLHDMRDTEMRKDNIMIFGLTESAVTSASESKENDLNLIRKLAESIGVVGVDITDCFRLGRRSEKPRPVKAICRIAHQRADLLRRAPQIRRLDVSLGFQRTFIKPDLSPKEQEADRMLRRELVTRREAGESVIIRGGRIINKVWDRKTTTINQD